MKITPFKEINPPNKNGYWVNKKNGQAYGGAYISPLLIPNLERVEKGFKSSMESGPISGFPVTDLKAELYDGDSHDVDSSVMAFEIASRAAFREGVMKSKPVLLEPIMRVEVVTPEEYMGDIIGDLNSRRGNVSSMDERGNARVVSAMVPLANMFGYVSTLRSQSQGRAQFTMHFDHYAELPQAVSEEVKEKLAS